MKIKLTIVLVIFVITVLQTNAQDFINGSFETGDYTGWTIVETAGGGVPSIEDKGLWHKAPNNAVSVAPLGTGLYAIYDSEEGYDGIIYDHNSGTEFEYGELPIEFWTADGTHSAYNVQINPGEHRIYQDIAISEEDDLLQFFMSWYNQAGAFDPVEQSVHINIRDVETDEIIETLFVTESPVEEEPALDEVEPSIPMSVFCFDISDYSGTTVRIDLDFKIFVAPLYLVFDNFRITQSDLTPDTPTLEASTVNSCPGADVTLSIASGELNNAGYWEWYEVECDGQVVGTGNSIVVNPIANTTYFAKAVDGCGDPGTCSEGISITVGDDEDAPVVDVESLPKIEDACSITITNFPTATDECIGEVIGVTEDPLYYDTPGEYTITWYYYDALENFVSQTQDIVVNDSESDTYGPIPDLDELPDLVAACYVSLEVEEDEPTATDGCSGMIYATTEDPYEYSEEGKFTITWVYEDETGNTTEQIQNVIVLSQEEDQEAPVPDFEFPPYPIEFPVCIDLSEALPTFTATDACDGEIIGMTDHDLAFTAEDIDNYVSITWEYEDSNGNSSSQTLSIYVYNDDPYPQELSTIETSCSYTVTETPMAYDACENLIIVATTEDPTTFSTPGEYSITWDFEDAYGYTAEQTQTIIVYDDGEGDEYGPIPNINDLDVTANCSLTISEAPLATDGCDGVITGTTEDELEFTEVGEYSITWIYTDASENTTEQNQTVWIVDDAPVADEENIDVTASCSLTISDAPTATDDCDGFIEGTTEDVLEFTEVGEYMITWTFMDSYENETVQVQTVTIIDEAPVADVESLDVSSYCAVTVSEAPTATDDCDGAIIGETEDALEFSEAGEHTITWTFMDSYENETVQVQTVTIMDAFNTSVTLSETTLTADLEGASYQWVDCGNENVAIDGATSQSFTPEESGNYVVEITLEGCTYTSDCTEIIVLSLDELESRIDLFPNPTFDYFTINMEGLQHVKIRINNVNGQLVDSRIATEKLERFDFSHQPKGIYIVSLNRNNELHQFKLIKK